MPIMLLLADPSVSVCVCVCVRHMPVMLFLADPLVSLPVFHTDVTDTDSRSLANFLSKTGGRVEGGIGCGGVGGSSSKESVDGDISTKLQRR